MQIKTIISLAILCLFSHTNWGQLKAQTVTIPLYENSGVQEIDVKINSVESRFILDTGASSVSFGKDFFQELKDKGVIDDSAIEAPTRVTLADGSIVPAQVVKLDNVQIGGLTLDNVRAIVLDQAGSAKLIGQSVLDRFGTVTIDNQNKQVRFETTPSSGNLQLGRLRFIPCDSAVVTEAQRLQSVVEGDNSIEVYQFEEEKSVPPPPAAMARIQNQITIRFFDSQDEDKAQTLSVILQSDGFQASDITVESMLPYYPGTIPDYIEIWVK